jgi:hypothetical protein
MTLNVGLTDRSVRIILVLLVGVLWFAGNITGTLAPVAGGVALILLATSLMGWCPLYTVLGIRTNKAAT